MEPRRSITFCADDFGISPAVNEAVEQAHLCGVLNAASLMVAGRAAADAVHRARRLPNLRVGLHLVVIEGHSVLPPSKIPSLVDEAAWFSSTQFSKSLAYFARAPVRRQLAWEIEAQFGAFAATGLSLDHANAHKHMHLHPVVGQMMIDAGCRYGLRRIRIPSEPPSVLAACGVKVPIRDRALFAWTSVLRHQARKAGLQVDDQVLGLHWSGHITTERLLRLLENLPKGHTEIYTHPATRRDEVITRLMPSYDHTAELDALCDPNVGTAVAQLLHYLPPTGASMGT